MIGKLDLPADLIGRSGPHARGVEPCAVVVLDPFRVGKMADLCRRVTPRFFIGLEDSTLALHCVIQSERVIPFLHEIADDVILVPQRGATRYACIMSAYAELPREWHASLCNFFAEEGCAHVGISAHDSHSGTWQPMMVTAVDTMYREDPHWLALAEAIGFWFDSDLPEKY